MKDAAMPAQARRSRPARAATVTISWEGCPAAQLDARHFTGRAWAQARPGLWSGLAAVSTLPWAASALGRGLPARLLDAATLPAAVLALSLLLVETVRQEWVPRGAAVRGRAPAAPEWEDNRGAMRLSGRTAPRRGLAGPRE
jgi:hypothetical protein